MVNAVVRILSSDIRHVFVLSNNKYGKNENDECSNCNFGHKNRQTTTFGISHDVSDNITGNDHLASQTSSLFV